MGTAEVIAFHEWFRQRANTLSYRDAVQTWSSKRVKLAGQTGTWFGWGNGEFVTFVASGLVSAIDGEQGK